MAAAAVGAQISGWPRSPSRILTLLIIMSLSARLARRLSRLALLVLLPGCAGAQRAETRVAPAPLFHADTARVRHALDSIADAHHGVVGYSIIDLETGDRLARRGDETFPTASLIKVGILTTVYDLVRQNKIALNDPLTVLRIDQVPGSGSVQYLHDGTLLTVHDAAWLMSTLSDNTATNLLLDRIGIRTMWDKMEALGLHHTKVHAKVFKRASSVAMDSSVKYGLGVTTPNEMAHLFELLAEGKAVSPTADSAMLDILEHNEDQNLLQRYLEGVRAAHKTGSTDSVRTECSLFYLRNRVVACVLTKENKDTRWIMETEPQLTMGHMGLVIARAWAKPETGTTAK